MTLADPTRLESNSNPDSTPIRWNPRRQFATLSVGKNTLETRMGRLKIGAVVAVAWMVVGCSDDNPGVDDGDVCVPGATQACVCSDGSAGAQACADGGDQWDSCACDDNNGANNVNNGANNGANNVNNGANNVNNGANNVNNGVNNGANNGVNNGVNNGANNGQNNGANNGGVGCLDWAFLDVSRSPGAGDAYPDPEVSARCEADALIVTSNGIPHYEFVAITPNPLSAQDYTWRLPNNPAVADVTTDVPLVGTTGVAVNGLPIFGPTEAPQMGSADPVVDMILDECAGHTAQRGDYHYHALVTACLAAMTVAPGEPSPILGVAGDGFPIYGPNGCLEAGCDEVVTFESSWEYLGDIGGAWDNNEYVAKDGPQWLDECNGRVGPDGNYRYHATPDFPYVMGCFRGTPGAQFGGMAGNNGGPQSCEQASDCEGACGPDALGCTCVATPMNEMVCAATCERDADCPEGDMAFMCGRDGVCIPARN